uniref:Uncharacterized protein n=1 Tax=Octopus bimaculoides TaxID=37653 RepID=A0A0L8G9J2_OCTBM
MFITKFDIYRENSHFLLICKTPRSIYFFTKTFHRFQQWFIHKLMLHFVSVRNDISLSFFLLGSKTQSSKECLKRVTMTNMITVRGWVMTFKGTKGKP